MVDQGDHNHPLFGEKGVCVCVFTLVTRSVASYSYMPNARDLIALMGSLGAPQRGSYAKRKGVSPAYIYIGRRSKI